jgi:hypothetical protein
VSAATGLFLKSLYQVFVCAIAIFMIARFIGGRAEAAIWLSEYFPTVSMTEPYVTVVNKAVVVINDAPDVKKSLPFETALSSPLSKNSMLFSGLFQRRQHWCRRHTKWKVVVVVPVGAAVHRP